MSKKMIWTIVAVAAVLIVVALVLLLSSGKNVKGTLPEIMKKLYAGISQENLPMALGNIKLHEENDEYYLGTTEIKYKEALASESMAGSVAHSVVLLRVEDANATVEALKANANPRKWVCVEASNFTVKSKGDLVILIMSNETLAPKLEANFNNL